MVKVALYYHSLLKRLIDLVLSLTLLVLLLPLLLCLALIVFIGAGKPILFVQKRLGKDKSSFLLYKFRTMKNEAEKEEAKLRLHNQAPFPMFKIFDDPRYVGIGKYLSHYGLDELPQLFNILKGEMSFVGPRPLPIYQAKKLDSSWDFRYQVKPGVFSEWSLSPKRHSSLEIWKRLEKKTLHQGSFLYEVQVISRTLWKQFVK